MKEFFTDTNFGDASRSVIAWMDGIVTTYLADGLSLTLRQLYYRLVASDKIPNTEKSYKRIGRILADARMAGLVDWAAIEDRERAVVVHQTWSGPESILRAAARSVCYDHWAEQDQRVEVWVEKKALIDVVARGCQRYRAPHFACKGYTSATSLYDAAQRFGEDVVVILYLGDHDPSGLDMPRDIASRLEVFGATGTVVKPIALTRAQIDHYGPPPNPAKMTDSRYKRYRQEHGSQSWELDALEPSVLIALVHDEIKRLIDHNVFAETLVRETRDAAAIREFTATFEG